MAVQNEWYAEGLRFTCTQCGKCCTGPSGYVWFSDDEAAAMAAFLRMAVPQFLAKVAHQVNGRWSLNETLTEHGYDCALLRRQPDGQATCAIYSVRPTQCRTWPFWPENLQRPDDWLRTAQRCPGMAEGLQGQGALYPVEHVRVIRDSNPRVLDHAHAGRKAPPAFPHHGPLPVHLTVNHEAVHLGQVSAWRRVQGLPSV